MSTSSSSSLLISLFLSFICLSILLLLKDLIIESDKGKILGGLLSSLLFLFSLTAFGNFQSSFNKETGWFEVISCLAFAEFVAINIHFVCFSSW